MKNFVCCSFACVLFAAAFTGCGSGSSTSSLPQTTASDPLPSVGATSTPGAGATAGATPRAATPTPSGAPSRAASPAPTTTPATSATALPTTTPATGATALPTSTPAPAPAQLQLPAGFSAAIIANVGAARELAALPNGDLLVATSGSTIAIVPAAEAAGSARAPSVFATIPDDDAASVGYGPDGNVYVGSDHGIWRLGYTSGALSAASIVRISNVRTGAVAPATDGDNHSTTSLAISGSIVYAGIGSDCNACTETDPQRASVQEVALSGGPTTTKAQNYRNPAALATDPTTGFVWAGGPGQDHLPSGHPYEELDDVSDKPGVLNYGWPNCYDDRIAVAGSGADCSSITLPAIVFPAYATPLGAAFYRAAAGTYVFPTTYRSGMFVSLHGSWHTTSEGSSATDPSAVQPQVVYVPFASGMPASPVNWTNPTTQYQVFFSNFGTTASSRIGRPTGLAIGVQGSLFVADDLKGNIYRIRPTAIGTQSLSGRR